MDVASPQFWVAVLQIIAIDIVLGGDNAVVIALACRRLPEKQRNLGIFWGILGAIALRVVLIFFALNLLAIPFLKILAAALLLWIGTKLLQPEPESNGHHVDASTTLLGAIKTIIIADAVMSLDNVIAIAGAAKDSLGLVVFGLVVSVPIIVLGSKLVMKLMTPKAIAPASTALRNMGSAIKSLMLGPSTAVTAVVDSGGRSLHNTMAPSAYRKATTTKEPAYSCSSHHARAAIAACGPISAEPRPPSNT